MKAKDVNKTIERLDDQDWDNMKKHLDEKFPSMTLPTVEDFKVEEPFYTSIMTKAVATGKLNPEEHEPVVA